MTLETSIPETKEQFLERTANVAMGEYWAWREKASANGATPHMADSVGWCGAALAVYEQALRDIRADFGGFYGGWEHGDEIDLRDELADFAAERGIDLEGK